MKSGLILIVAGFLMVLAGAGTSDMEIASGGGNLFTGVPLAALGLLALAAGARLLNRRQTPKG